MERMQFTFYRSYYEAIRHLSKKDREAVLMAVCAYALDEIEPSLSGVAASVFTLIRPTLDSGRNKAKNRINKKESNAEQTENKSKTNEEQTGKEKEVEEEREEERENDSSPPKSPAGDWADLVRSQGYPERLEQAVLAWLCYKREKRQSYKPTGLSTLLRTIGDKARQHGEDVVIEAIEYAMSCNWQGIAWDKLKATPQSAIQAERRFFDE